MNRIGITVVVLICCGLIHSIARAGKPGPSTVPTGPTSSTSVSVSVATSRPTSATPVAVVKVLETFLVRQRDPAADLPSRLTARENSIRSVAPLVNTTRPQ